MTGTTALHAQLEEELADFTGAPQALVFSSGYLANLSAVTALAFALSGDGLLIVTDERNHASLIDACRLARGRNTAATRRARPTRPSTSRSTVRIVSSTGKAAISVVRRRD